MKIVAGIAVKNEEWIIGKNLESLSQYCDKIIISDDHSTDKTVEICKSFPKVELFIRPEHPWYKREEGKQRIELWKEVIKHNPDYILLLDGDEIPTPSIINFLENIDTSVDCWRVRMINLWKDDKHYRKDRFKTSTGHEQNLDPFSKDSWKKTVLLKYNLDYNYTYNSKVEKGPVSKFHPLPDNTTGKIVNTEDFYIIHYGKISKSFTSGEKNKNYSKMEEFQGRGSYKKQLLHHEACRLEGKPAYEKAKEEWFWDVEDRGEKIVKGSDTFTNDKGEINNYYLTENINWLGLIHTKEGSLRSNHYHPVQEQKVLNIKGRYLSVSKDLNKNNSEVKIVEVQEGDLIVTPSYVAHTNIFLEDTISINIVNGDRKEENFGKHTINYELVTKEEKEDLYKQYKDKK